MDNKMCVPAMKRVEIRNVAQAFREALGLENVREIPIVEVLELLGNSDFLTLEIVNKAEMSEEARAFPSEMYLKVREDVYESAVSGSTRFRFTIAHELGHILLHKNIKPSFARNGSTVATCCDPEWQADCFAGELLVSERLCRGMTPIEISQVCGVSRKAAEVQYRKMPK